MEYRNLCADDLHRGLFDKFIRHQVVIKCWRKENGKWLIKNAPFIDDWSENDYQTLIAHLKGVLLSNGFVYGAFDHGALKGFVSVDAEPFGVHQEYLDLTNLHVSEDFRGKGIGRTLFHTAAEWARNQGAAKLYLSAHSAVESQAFYHSMGCVEAETYHQKHVEAEPYDCQLEYPL